MMPVLLMELSKLTSRCQTTVPAAVRKHLNLKKGDRIVYRAEDSGRVYIDAASETDPALAPFLALLEADIRAHPDRLKPVDGSLVAHMQQLVGDVEIDLDAPLPPESL